MDQRVALQQVALPPFEEEMAPVDIVAMPDMTVANKYLDWV